MDLRPTWVGGWIKEDHNRLSPLTEVGVEAGGWACKNLDNIGPKLSMYRAAITAGNHKL